MLVVEGLTRSFSQLSLEIPRLRLEKGRIFVLLGPTGAGKSRFLELLAGFSEPDQGSVTVDGVEVMGQPPDQRRISIVFQEATLFPHLNVRQNILYSGKDQILFQQLVTLLDLEAHLSKPVHVLSGGERQLVAIARALMVRPLVLLLDEPFSAIDPQSRRRVVEAVRRAHQELHITSLMVTHNFEEALYLGTELGILMGGKLVQVGPPDEVFLRPADPVIAKFLGLQNLFAGHFERKADAETPAPFPALFKSPPAVLHVLADHEGPGYVLIHPREITLSLEPTCSSALNQLRGKIQEISSGSATAEMRVDAGLIFKVFITHQSLLQLRLVKGSEVYLTFKASSARTY